jgi:hypothetical protein
MGNFSFPTVKKLRRRTPAFVKRVDLNDQSPKKDENENLPEELKENLQKTGQEYD